MERVKVGGYIIVIWYYWEIIFRFWLEEGNRKYLRQKKRVNWSLRTAKLNNLNKSLNNSLILSYNSSDQWLKCFHNKDSLGKHQKCQKSKCKVEGFNNWGNKFDNLGFLDNNWGKLLKRKWSH